MKKKLKSLRKRYGSKIPNYVVHPFQDVEDVVRAYHQSADLHRALAKGDLQAAVERERTRGKDALVTKWRRNAAKEFALAQRADQAALEASQTPHKKSWRHGV